jgi:predicted N-acetyltransferase YhbS
MISISVERPEQRAEVLALNRAAFGFSTGLASHLASPFQGSDAFMALELKPGALAGKQGVCRYPAAFGL